MTETKRPLKVFLSYASQDKPVVWELSGRLAGEGWIDPWVDEKKLLPGQDWRTKIEEAVETSDIVIICLSSNSVSKEGYVQKELRYAREIALEKPEETIFLIPLRLDECEVPRGLRFYQWVDYFGGKRNDSYSALIESLKLRYEQKLKLEEAERARQEEKKRKHDDSEKAKQEKLYREIAEWAEHGEKQDREAKEKATSETVAREKAEKEATEKVRLEVEEQARQKAVREKAALEKEKRDATEKAKREKVERQTAHKAALAKTFSNFFTTLKSVLPKAKPVFRTIVIIGILIILFWVVSWGIPKLASFVPTAKANLTPTHRPGATITFTVSPQPPTTTLTPKPTSTKTQMPAPTTTLPSQYTDPKGVEMVLVPAGEFTMGSDYGRENSTPPHNVYLDPFYIDKYEVTNGLYKICQEAGICQPPKNIGSRTHSLYYGYSQFENFPVVYVDWFFANTYCKWRGARLPTEAEWEKAARGTDSRDYAWGNMTGYEVMCDKANYRPCYGDSRPVGSYENGKSIYSIFEMTGNVAEWVSSAYSPYPYVANDGRENINQTDQRIIRGGAFDYNYFELNVYDRVALGPDIVFDDVGFRCALAANP